MAKIGKDKIIEKNLKYIGLDINKIPEFLTEFEPLNFRPLKSYDDVLYKVYRYVDIKNIEILISPTDRLTDLKDRYKLASPIVAYLDPQSEENIEKYATFLKMVSTIDVGKIEEIEEEQKIIKENIPCEVKYSNHFIWQIYYSDASKKYFMLVPENEKDQSALFYLLKKQIENLKKKKSEKIFVPITHLEYSDRYLTKFEISDIEKYLWYFTKDWASVYEVYDEKNHMSIRIVGQTNVYEKVKSKYFIQLKSKEEAIELYKLLKAMFILSTAVPEEYTIETKIAADGGLELYHKNTLLTYKELSQYVNNEYELKKERIEKEIAESKKLQKRLKRFNSLVEELTQEYLLKQRQIATFLECKKTFFGRVRYYFKKKKDTPVEKKKESLREREEAKKENDNIYEIKEQYTIEDLINICSKLQEKIKINTNLNLDIKAIENKKEILSRKVDNAELYIKEIDKHKKSIFEFWKFTSKDEVQTLAEGEVEEEKKDKILKYFNYETDLEDLGKNIDELQRRKLSKNETDSIFAAKQVIDSIKEIYIKENREEKTNSKILENQLKELQEEYKSNLEYITIKDFDIFGSLTNDYTKIKEINNQKHREIEKDKYKVLNINLETDLESYTRNLEGFIALIKEALNKIKLPYNMSVYKTNSNDELSGIDLWNINPEETINEMLKNNKEKILYKINLKENMPILFYTNIIFFDNFNKTLPIGMDLSTEVLLDGSKFTFKQIKEEEFSINNLIDEFNNITEKIKVYEYDLEEKINS